MNRIVIIVLDGFGIGSFEFEIPHDSRCHPHTLQHVAQVSKIDAPFLSQCGLGHVAPVPGVEKRPPIACWGRTRQMSPFCESYAAHWEMSGAVATSGVLYPEGVPNELIGQIESTLDRRILGNMPCYPHIETVPSDTLAEHLTTGDPILLTNPLEESIATFALFGAVTAISPDELFCTARMLRDSLATSGIRGRAIAKTMDCSYGSPRVLQERIDFPFFEPPSPNLLESVLASGRNSIAIGKVGSLFSNRGFTHILPEWGSDVIWKNIYDTIDNHKSGLIWANLNDLNRPFGCNRDCAGWAACLKTFDRELASLPGRLTYGDLLIITGDHGTDPSLSGEHTKEWNPLFIFAHGLQPIGIGDKRHVDIAATIADIWSMDYSGRGRSFASELCFAG